MVIIMLKSDKELMLMYYITIEALEQYIKTTGKRPNERTWNRYAVENNYLSGETIGYICGIGFNKLCRILIKNKNKKL